MEEMTEVKKKNDEEKDKTIGKSNKMAEKREKNCEKRKKCRKKRKWREKKKWRERGINGRKTEKRKKKLNSGRKSKQMAGEKVKKKG